jgi:NMD protein affecting ribosome stability and mRNA decay
MIYLDLCKNCGEYHEIIAGGMCQDCLSMGIE